MLGARRARVKAFAVGTRHDVPGAADTRVRRPTPRRPGQLSSTSMSSSFISRRRVEMRPASFFMTW